MPVISQQNDTKVGLNVAKSVTAVLYVLIVSVRFFRVIVIYILHGWFDGNGTIL